jgi:hypothetical protein
MRNCAYARRARSRHRSHDMRTKFALVLSLITTTAISAMPAIATAATPYIGRFDVNGRVVAFHSFSMTLLADGREVAVDLHHGTIIHPTGLTLQPGMFVRVNGYWSDGQFQANRIVLR